MTEEQLEKSANGRGLWIGVAIGFGLLAIAWSGLFFAAHHVGVKDVKLEHQAEESS